MLLNVQTGAATRAMDYVLRRPAPLRKRVDIQNEYPTMNLVNGTVQPFGNGIPIRHEYP